MVVSIVVYLLVAASYLQVKLNDDGVIYYNFMRRVLGDDVNGYAYQFGVSIWDTPFYLGSRIVTWAHGGDALGHISIGVASVAFASTTAVVVIFYLSWRLLRDLGLPGGPGAILLTVFGSPLFYETIFEPEMKHAFDTLLMCALALLLFRASVVAVSPRLALALGAVGALQITVRYANLTLLAGVVFVLLRKRERWQAYVVVLVSVAGAAVILALPLVLGIPYGLPPTATAQPVVRSLEAGSQPVVAPRRWLVSSAIRETHGAVRLAGGHTLELAAAVPGGGVDSLSSFQFDPLVPFKMLFTIHRGLFVWTPLTFFGVIGYLLLLRRDRQHRTFLTGLGLSALALLLVHSLWGGFWDGGFSFSQRFLTALFPVFVIGVAELLSRIRMLVILPVLILCVAWTGFLAVHHFYGYDGVSARDGPDRVVQLYVDGNENLGTFWTDRISGPVGGHWDAYFDWVGLH
jgi:hypothetical protein